MACAMDLGARWIVKKLARMGRQDGATRTRPPTANCLLTSSVPWYIWIKNAKIVIGWAVGVRDARYFLMDRIERSCRLGLRDKRQMGALLPEGRSGGSDSVSTVQQTSKRVPETDCECKCVSVSLSRSLRAEGLLGCCWGRACRGSHRGVYGGVA